MERDPKVTSYVMSCIRGRDTGIERKLRKALFDRGVRFSTCRNDVFGHPDIVIKGLRIAIFCDSEFWHGYHFEENKQRIHKNLDYWIPKIERNIARDQEVNETLKEQGYLVLRFWGKQIEKDLESVIAEIMEVVNRRREIISRMQSEKVLTTLAYVEKDGCYLMLYRNKKKNDLNQGKWVGVGGHVESGESAIACVKREIEEETGLEVKKYRYLGKVYFLNSCYPAETMYLFHIQEAIGEVKECNEGELRYIPISEVYDLPMWDGDRIFLPLIEKAKAPFELMLGYDGDELIDAIGPIYKPTPKKGKKKHGRKKR